MGGTSWRNNIKSYSLPSLCIWVLFNMLKNESSVSNSLPIFLSFSRHELLVLFDIRQYCHLDESLTISLLLLLLLLLLFVLFSSLSNRNSDAFISFCLTVFTMTKRKIKIIKTFLDKIIKFWFERRIIILKRCGYMQQMREKKK